MAKDTEKPTTAPAPAQFSKTQFLGQKDRSLRDVYAVVLEDDKTYTKEDANKLATAYLERKVK
ncbi:MAG: hypothetical protein ACK5JF_02800 [Oscillospiraceae bacterium]